MKRIVFFVFCVTFSVLLNAQIPQGVKFRTESNISSIKKNADFEIVDITYTFDYRKFATGNQTIPTYLLNIEQAGKQQSVAAIDLPKDLVLQASENNLQNYWFIQNLRSLKTISEIKDLNSVRYEHESDADEYINTLSRYNLIFDDPYLESYLYSLVTKIAPAIRADGFPSDIRIVIVNDPSMNAAVFPNGTMIVNTGLLSLVHTEDELVASLAHEIAHFVANHSLVNYRRMEKAQARAEFWAGLGVVLAAAASAATVSSGYYYNTSNYVYSAAILSAAAAASVMKKIGMEFSKEQEEEADKMALEAINLLGYDKNALATLFQRMGNTFKEDGNWAAYYLSTDHPSINDRIKYCGTPKTTSVSKSYEKTVSFAISETAIAKYNQGRFSQALKYVNQNINNGVGTDDDYLIKALCLINLFNDSAHNKEAMEMIQMAKTINGNNSNIIRTEIIANLRNNNMSEASSLISAYIERLTSAINNCTDDSSKKYSFLSTELEWARKMLLKVKGL